MSRFVGFWRLEPRISSLPQLRLQPPTARKLSRVCSLSLKIAFSHVSRTAQRCSPDLVHETCPCGNQCEIDQDSGVLEEN